MILYAQCDCCIGKSWTCNWKIQKSDWSVIDSLEQLPFGLGTTEVAEWHWLAHLGFTARLNGSTTIDPRTIPDLDMLNMLAPCKLSYEGRRDLDLGLARELVHVLVVSGRKRCRLCLASFGLTQSAWKMDLGWVWTPGTKRSRNAKGLRLTSFEFSLIMYYLISTLATKSSNFGLSQMRVKLASRWFASISVLYQVPTGCSSV